MKKVFILSGPYQHGHRPKYSKVFSRAIPAYEFIDVELDNLIVEISPDKFLIKDSASGLDIKDADLVMLREYTGNFLDLAFVVSKYLEHNRVEYFNKDYMNYRPVSKLAQAAIFYELGLPFPDLVFSVKPDLLASLAVALGFPLILKEAQASHGDNNFLVKSPDELERLLSDRQELKFIAQKYVPNDGDYRLLLMGGRTVLQIYRQGQGGTHLNNTSKGAAAQLSDDLPQEVLRHAKELVRHMDLELAGVDILLDGAKKPYFLEINYQPQIISGALVDEKLASIKDLIEHQLGRSGS